MESSPYLFAELDRKIAQAKAKGVDVISLGVGDPDLPTPAPIVKALQEAVADPSTHNYSSYTGTDEFRRAAADWMRERFGVEIDPSDEVIALIGSKEGLAHLILTYIAEGDVTLYPSPAYPVYRNFTLLCGGEPVAVPLLPENEFLPDLDAISPDAAKRAKLLFLNYPNNPTGAIAPESFIKKAIEFCTRHDILLCHDNAYSEMTFDGYKAPSFLSVPGAKDVCIEMFSTSKMYNMTGWRIGFAAGNKAALKALGTVKDNTDSSAFKAIQRAAAEGFKHSDELTKDLNDIYGRRRKIFIEGLNRLGWDFHPPAATFYLWIPVPASFTSEEFAALLLEKCGIVVPPGSAYGPEGEGFFRVALTAPEERLKEALARMEKAGIRFDDSGNLAKTA